MLEVTNLLASYGLFGGGSIGNIIAQWEAAGVFHYVLPFLLLFAITFGLLMRVKIFTLEEEGDGKKPNKSINAIIALSVSLMALQFDFVSLFFAELFPRVGVALSIILVLIIIGGLFLPSKNKGFTWGLIAIVFIIIAIVIFQSLSAFGFSGGGYWFRNNMGSLIGWAVFIGLIIAIVSGSTSPKDKNAPETAFGKLLQGN